MKVRFSQLRASAVLPGGRPRPLARCAALSLALLAAGAPAAVPRQVVLPLAQYEELRTKAKTTPEPPPPPAAPFAIESDDMDVVAGPVSARVVQTLAVRLLAADWQSIPVGDAGSFVGADLGDLEGRLADGPKGSVLQVRGQGDHRVRLESVVKVVRDETVTRPTWRFALRPPAAAVVQGALRLTAPLAGTVVEAALGANGLLQGPRGPGGPGGPGDPGERSAWSFAAKPGQDLEVRLLGRAVLPERARLPLRFEATTASSATLSRTRLEVHGRVVARVAQGRLTELRLRLPEGFAVESLTPPGLGWKVDGGTLAITPPEPVEETLQLAVELTGSPRDSFAAPLLLPEGAARTIVLTRAVLQGDGLLVVADLGSTRPPDGFEIAPLAADPALAGAKLYLVGDPARPPRWQAEWAERTEVLAAQVDGLWVELTAGDAGRAGYQVWALVRNRATTQLAMVMPPGFELMVASRDGLPLAPGLGSEQELTVPVLSRESPQLVHLAGVMPFTLPRGAGRLSVPLPSLSAPAARIHVRLLLPGGRSYALADTTRAAP
ncbi:MAG: hypothetical protein JOZ15_17395, partial [Acidobacteria bacterium]|nr:hypothetical protein [Acidobacteriota bacterium]